MDREREPVLTVEDLQVDFHLRGRSVRAVDGVSLEVFGGESVGLVGESGCGKTTTGLAAMGLLASAGRITHGSVKVGGRELVGLSERELCRVRGNEIGMVFQDPQTSLNPTMRIGRQIAEAVRLHRAVTRDEAYERAVAVLRLVGMPRPEERMGAYPHQLSGGLRQRVMIAIALACDPKVLIADEPTTALDVTIQAQILDLIDELRQRLGMAVLLVTHDMGVIAGRTDRVMVMYAGRIVEQATTAQVFGETRHRYSEALLGSVPRLDQDRSQRLRSIGGLPPDLGEPIEHCRFAPRCQYAAEDCWATDPPLVQSQGDAAGHLVACYHPSEASPAVAVRAGSTSGVSSTAVPRDAALATAPVLVAVRELVKEYPAGSTGALHRPGRGVVHAVSGVSFDVRQGETFGLVGESGCGKTTIGRLVVALERATSGSVRFEGMDVQRLRGKALRRHRRNLQLMFQDPYASLDPRMRVGTILREPLAVQGIGDRAERDRRVHQILEEVGLASAAEDRYPHELSGGQRQRVGLARALVLEPKLIVADEPVSSLDVSVQAQVLNLLTDLQDRHGLTYVFVTHDLAVARYIADSIAVMYLGKLVEVGPVESIFADTAHPYTQALLDAVPEPDPQRERSKEVHHVHGELPSAVNPPSGCRFRTRCSRAQDRCAEEEPPLRSFGVRHMAACHFPLRAPAEGGTPSAAGVATTR